MRVLKRHYAELYTWSHFYGDQVMAHSDGAVSCLIEWDGIDAEMMTDAECKLAWEKIYTILNVLGTEYCAEFHFWREYDDALVHEYLDRGKDMIRGQALGMFMRRAMAEHLAPFAMVNKVGVVLTRLPKKRLLFLGAGRDLIQQGRDADSLLEHADDLRSRLPGGRVVNKDVYLQRIMQSYDRDLFLSGANSAVDSRFSIAEQVLREAPRVSGKSVVVGDSVSRVLLVHLYPDAYPGWFQYLSTTNVPMHVSQVVIPVDTRDSLRASEKASDVVEGSTGRRGRNSASKTLSALNNFQEFVTENNLNIFKNCFIIHLHGDPEVIKESSKQITDWINRSGQVRDADYVQLPYFRAAQPGQGYLSPLFRPDHTWQVGNMVPVQVFRTGAKRPESIRLGQSGALIGFDIGSETVPHSFTVSMTGGGKGVDKVATIIETYPMGIDWYISEIGGSYRWVVEGFGGTYSKIDPNHTVVNPLPPYAVIDNTKSLPLDAKLAGGTVNSLAFLLTDGKTDLTIHQAAAAQSALQLLYACADSKREAPTLPDYLRELEIGSRELEGDLQRIAAKDMADNLSSFLDTTEGRIFAQDDNLILSEGITGVDLKEVDRASPKLLKFYLVFLALRFNNLAFARRNNARVLLDELHKFVKIAPEVMGRLISELGRMGRKDLAAIDLVTQGIAEIDVIEKEVLNSMPLRSLLYRPDGWDEIAGRINMPDGALEIWRAFPNPLDFNWRPAIRSVGDMYYNLHLTFPHPMLDMAATSATDLDLKDQIDALYRDPFERLAEFRRRKEIKK